MQCFRLFSRIVTLLLLLAAASALHAQEGLSDAFARLHASGLTSNSVFGPSLVMADFNNDNHADGALLLREHNTFRIELHFRHHRAQSLSFAATVSTLALRALDVNQDGNPDLVVEDPFSRRWLFVWLNDGRGGFHSVSVDTYPGNIGSDYRGFVSPPPGRESDLLLGPGKMRSRNSPPFTHRQIRSLFRFGLTEMPGYTSASSEPVPNLVRGSPFLNSL